MFRDWLKMPPRSYVHCLNIQKETRKKMALSHSHHQVEDANEE